MKKIIGFGIFLIVALLILQSTIPATVQADDMSSDIAALETLVAQSLEHNGREYTNETWRAFAKALSEAQIVLADSYDSQAAVTDAYTALRTTSASLVPIASFGNPFTDVARTNWFYEAVQYVNANSIMPGVTTTSFQPIGTLSREMVVDALYRAESQPHTTFEPLFYDVLESHKHSSAIIWAATNGIITGMDDNRFAPSEYITREQLATILHRYAKFKNYNVTVPETFNISSFIDHTQVSSYAYDAVHWTVYRELMRGSDGRLNPRGTATRAEYATLLQRLIDRFEFNRQEPQTDPQTSQQYIAWQFITYLEPDFMSEKQEFLPPQSVNVVERRNDGWARITTGIGDRWVFLQANMIYVERTVHLYNNPHGSRDAMLEPQVVTVLQTQEGGWYQISTWLGPRWIYLRPGIQPGDGLRIALTFDDGPSSHTKQLLDALYERGVLATFFVLGQQVASNPTIAARIVDEGHEIAAHSYRHPDLTKMSAAGIRSELTQGRDIIYQHTGVKPTLLRPPYGSRNSTVQSVAAEFGYPLILWSVDTRDWESRNVNSIMSHFKSNNAVKIREGDIILMHDIYSTTIEAAIKAIDLLLAEGFAFVTVSELLIYRFGELTPGKVYSSAR